MSIKTLSPEAEAYTTGYAFKPFGAKLGGAQVFDPQFPKFCEDVNRLRGIGANVRIVAGNGPLISKIASERGIPRVKVHGVGKTTPELLNGAVEPAYQQAMARIREHMPDAYFVPPEHVECAWPEDPQQRDDWGLVGLPKRVIIPPEKDLVVIGSMGHVDGQLVNVNGDPLKTCVARQTADTRQRFEEVFFMTEKVAGAPCGGVLDKNRQIVPFIERGRIPTILAGNDSEIGVDGGMVPKLQSVQEILNYVSKVVMTDIASLWDELTHEPGKGTMFYDPDQERVGPLLAHHAPLVRALCHHHQEEGNFKPREPGEWDDLLTRCRTVTIGNTLLGFFALTYRGDNWVEIEAFSAATDQKDKGNGVGKKLLDAALGEVDLRNVYATAVSIPGQRTFRGNGFEELGPLQDGAKNHPYFPPFLNQYSASDRNPIVFVSLGANRVRES